MQITRLLLLACAISFAISNRIPVISENDYAFYYPLYMTSNKPAKVCLEIDKALIPADVKVAFGNRTCGGKWLCGSHTVRSDFSCWMINPPMSNTTDNTPSAIKLEIRTRNQSIQFYGEDQVVIQSSYQRVFIETDRGVYKMGDTVKVRLLVLRNDLKPATNYKIPKLQLVSPYPSSKIVKVWENIVTTLGLAHLEFQLAPDTPEGDWTITGDDIYTSFQVEKYVLPRFEVLLDGPTVIYNGTEDIIYTVCGKYSYGRSMKGVALLEFGNDNNLDTVPNTISKIEKLENGCAKFEIPAKQISAIGYFVTVRAAITEEGTGQVETTQSYVSVDDNPYSYKWEDSGRFYKPELPYQAKLLLIDVHIPLFQPLVEICYEIDYEQPLACSNFTMASDNTVEFVIPPNMSITEDIQIVANVIDYPLSYSPRLYLTTWHSTYKNALKILPSIHNQNECGSTLRFTVWYTSELLPEGAEIEFKYILSSRGAMIDVGSVVDTPKRIPIDLDIYPNVVGHKKHSKPINIVVDKFVIEIELEKQIYTSSKLIIYYEFDNEIISDAIDIDVRTCSPNQVKAKWSESSLYPGETASLKIEADPNSLCSVSSIDKASTFLGINQAILIDNIISMFYPYVYIDKPNCVEPIVTPTTSPPDQLIGEDKFFIRFPIRSPGFDSYEAFKDSSIGVISNLIVISKPCRYYKGFPRISLFEAASTQGAPDTRPAPPAVDNRGSAVRSFFPETWLWDLVPLSASGRITLKRKLPDSITEWQGNVICTSLKNGVGISDKIEITGFKPFFVDILLPYSIKRNKEILHLTVPIFNYLNNSLPIKVTLEANSDIILVDGEDKNTVKLCLGPQDSYTHTYRIKATKLGSIDITVAADVDPIYAPHCASNSVTRRKDVVRKPILVEPEGYPSYLLKSALLCANDTSGITQIDWLIELPKDVVPDTVDGKVTLNSDILGPMFQNLENILMVPTGCGEQTMATLTPNLYVLKYLEANNALTDQIKAKILANLEIGYQRMLNYVHLDGSFSAFGQSDQNGSTFLTAFVIRTFKEMKKYIYIDEDVINQAVAWIISHQLPNGCFDPMQHVIHEMGIASSPNQTTALTSYVLISFLETGIVVADDVLSHAKQCILSDLTIDKYTLAISSYAMGLMGITNEVNNRIHQLMQLADVKDDMIWWTETENSVSANVETTSWVLISLLKQDPSGNLGTALSIVRWLQSEMNPSGGFYSTADTVVGLDALSRYAAIVNKNEPNVRVTITTSTETKEFVITKRDSSATEFMPLKIYPNEVKATIQGQGCVALQAVVQYYVDQIPNAEDLKLEVQVKPVTNDSCSPLELTPCVSYVSLTSNKINMAVVEVDMPSGYAPDQASLYALTSAGVVKKFELKGNKVIFYLIELGKDKVCMPFKIEENVIVENISKACVKFYDYYNPQLSISTSFQVGNCKTKS